MCTVILLKRDHAYSVLLLLFESWWTCGSQSTANCLSEEANGVTLLMLYGTVIAYCAMPYKEIVALDTSFTNFVI